MFIIMSHFCLILILFSWIWVTSQLILMHTLFNEYLYSFCTKADSFLSHNDSRHTLVPGPPRPNQMPKAAHQLYHTWYHSNSPRKAWPSVHALLLITTGRRQVSQGSHHADYQAALSVISLCTREWWMCDAGATGWLWSLGLHVVTAGKMFAVINKSIWVLETKS